MVAGCLGKNMESWSVISTVRLEEVGTPDGISRLMSYSATKTKDSSIRFNFYRICEHLLTEHVSPKVFATFYVESLSDVVVCRGDLFSLKEVTSLMARILSGFLTRYIGLPEGCAFCSSCHAALGFLTSGYHSSLPPFPLFLAVHGLIGLLWSWHMPAGKAVAHLSAVQCTATIHCAKPEMEGNSTFYTC